MIGVAVVGGGLAGLFTAARLAAAGRDDVVVLEAGSRPGGVARTITRDGYQLEPAVGSLLLPHPHLSPLLEWIGGEIVPAEPAAAGRLVHTGGRTVPVPATPRALLSPLLPVTAKLRALAEPAVRAGPPDGDETLHSFMTRRFGDRAGSALAWLAAAGVHAGDPERLSAEAAFPMLAALEAAAGSVIRGGLARRRERPPGAPLPTPHLPVGGMAGLADAAAARLGDRFRPGFPVEAVHRTGAQWILEGPERLEAAQVVLACRPEQAARLVEKAGGGRELLGRAEAAPVAVVGLGGRSDRMPLPAAFGALAGRDAGMAALGFLFESSYAPGRAPEGHSLVKVIAGGATAPSVAGWDDDRLVARVGSELARVLGTDVEASFVEVVRHRPGIPQYVIGHRSWLEGIEELLAGSPGLHVTGWGYRGVGAAHLATDAVRVVERVSRGPRP